MIDLFVLAFPLSTEFMVVKGANSACKVFYETGQVAIVKKVDGNGDGDLFKTVPWKCLPPEQKDPPPFLEYPSKEDDGK